MGKVLDGSWLPCFPLEGMLFCVHCRALHRMPWSHRWKILYHITTNAKIMTLPRDVAFVGLGGPSQDHQEATEMSYAMVGQGKLLRVRQITHSSGV
jgi:hypothetical protein